MKIPVLVGSGISVSNVTQYLNANAIIIGSYLKLHGQWFNDLDPNKVTEFMGKVMKHREELKEDPFSVAPMRNFDLTAEGE